MSYIVTPMQENNENNDYLPEIPANTGPGDISPDWTNLHPSRKYDIELLMREFPDIRTKLSDNDITSIMTKYSRLHRTSPDYSEISYIFTVFMTKLYPENDFLLYFYYIDAGKIMLNELSLMFPIPTTFTNVVRENYDLDDCNLIIVKRLSKLFIDILSDSEIDVSQEDIEMFPVMFKSYIEYMFILDEEPVEDSSSGKIIIPYTSTIFTYPGFCVILKQYLIQLRNIDMISRQCRNSDDTIESVTKLRKTFTGHIFCTLFTEISSAEAIFVGDIRCERDNNPINYSVSDTLRIRTYIFEHLFRNCVDEDGDIYRYTIDPIIVMAMRSDINPGFFYDTQLMLNNFITRSVLYRRWEHYEVEFMESDTDIDIENIRENIIANIENVIPEILPYDIEIDDTLNDLIHAAIVRALDITSSETNSEEEDGDRQYRIPLYNDYNMIVLIAIIMEDIVFRYAYRTRNYDENTRRNVIYNIEKFIRSSDFESEILSYIDMESEYHPRSYTYSYDTSMYSVEHSDIEADDEMEEEIDEFEEEEEEEDIAETDRRDTSSESSTSDSSSDTDSETSSNEMSDSD